MHSLIFFTNNRFFEEVGRKGEAGKKFNNFFSRHNELLHVKFIMHSSEGKIETHKERAEQKKRLIVEKRHQLFNAVFRFSVFLPTKPSAQFHTIVKRICFCVSSCSSNFE